ncbi:MAG: hypothetical protein P8J30_09955, partial [Ilumatobacter sp.]|nr:hypothetical protein [Ilumatobacter sp.]
HSAPDNAAPEPSGVRAMLPQIGDSDTGASNPELTLTTGIHGTSMDPTPGQTSMLLSDDDDASADSPNGPAQGCDRNKSEDNPIG